MKVYLNNDYHYNYLSLYTISNTTVGSFQS